MALRDIFAEVTNKIVEAMEQGDRPWFKSWKDDGSGFSLPRRANGEFYKGINILLLWGAAQARGFVNPHWMTYRQAAGLGAHVRMNEQGTTVVFADKIKRTEQDKDGQDVEKTIPFLKAYTVFNVAQIDGLEPPYTEVAEKPGWFDAVGDAEAFFRETGAQVFHGGNRAYYNRERDFIQLPMPSAFKDAEAYEAVKAHEVVHWTGHATRCNRQFGERFGDDAYAVEELVAEMGSAFLCASLGVSAEPREDHSSYLSHWLKVLKADKKAIFTASTKAQGAVDFLYGAQPT